MGSISIACYKPKPGCEEALLQLVRNHLPPLRAAGLLTKRAQQTRPGRRNDRRVCPFRRAAVAACALVTERASIVMRASDGTIVEVFEWVSQEAIASAHNNPVVLGLWKKFEAVCSYEIPSNVAGFNTMFSHFEPL